MKLLKKLLDPEPSWNLLFRVEVWFRSERYRIRGRWLGLLNCRLTTWTEHFTEGRVARVFIGPVLVIAMIDQPRGTPQPHEYAPKEALNGI